MSPQFLQESQQSDNHYGYGPPTNQFYRQGSENQMMAGNNRNMDRSDQQNTDQKARMEHHVHEKMPTPTISDQKGYDQHMGTNELESSPEVNSQYLKSANNAIEGRPSAEPKSEGEMRSSQQHSS